jgi:L-threonylcarbamoyladenylate synthase
MPTETVYGLAARVDLPQAIDAIFKLKQRPSFDPLIVHVESLDQVTELVNDWSPLAKYLASAFWPGPLTLVLKKKSSLNPMISAGLDTVGIRMPDHPLALALIRAAGMPLAAPSANRFGRTSPTSLAHVRSEFEDAIARKEIFLLDGGDCAVGVESTVCLVESTSVAILRPGGVTKEAILERLAKTHEFSGVQVTNSTDSNRSPGHTEHHYETQKPLIFSWSEPLNARDDYQIGENRFSVSNISEIVLPTDPRLAARALYASLREADQIQSSRALFIRRDLTSSQNQLGLWAAIDDRLTRAARLQIGSPPKRV